MSSQALTIAIDGPAGSGKSTISSRLAQKLGYMLVDTGAIYRSVALYALKHDIFESDRDTLAQAIKKLDIQFQFHDGHNRVSLNGQDITEAIRENEISSAASRYSQIPEVRAALLQLQRDLAGQGGAVLEGRDIGTVVLPEAEVKFFLDASVEQRAQRRAKELQERGQAVHYEQLLSEIKERDLRDSQRAVAPLKPADDAIIVDSTSMSIQAVLDFMLDAIEQRKKAPSTD